MAKLKLTDDEVIAALESEESQATDGTTGELARQRADALDRYRGALYGNEVEGRSQVVDRSIMDTIEWIMPSLVRVYLGGDNIGQFDARGPEDEEAAKIETEVCSWYLEAKNDTFSQINATLRDALLLKNGYMVGYWQSKYDTMVETYKGLADEEVTMLMQDSEVNVVEHTEYPDPLGQAQPPMPGHPPAPPAMLHDVRVERKTCEEFVQVESIPPEELLVSRRHRWTSLLDCDFVEWVRRNVTIGQLRAEGFKIEDDEPGYDADTQEAVSRDRFGGNTTWLSRQDTSPDPSRRMVTFRDAYMRIDLRGTGIPQLWRFCRVEGSTNLILREQVDIIPFAAFTPLVYPHSHIGTSVYDLISDLGIIKTTLQRIALDGMYTNVSGRMAVDVNRVNLDDMLVSRPNQIVRVEGDPNSAMFPIQTPDTSASVLGMLEFIEGQKEGRTGVTRYSSGLDANTLNKTATGIQQIQSAANQRLELIARTVAGGFKDLFLIIHALACKHSTKPIQIKLKNGWTPVNPREWTRRTDFSISVGLGTGSPEQQLQKLQVMAPAFQQGMQMGLAGSMEAYNFGVEMWKAAGYRNPDKFIHAPQKDPQTGEPTMPPPQPSPQEKVEQMRQQGQQAQFQATQQADVQKFQAEQQMKREEQQGALALQASNDQRQSQLDQQKHILEMANLEKEYQFKQWDRQQTLAAELEKEVQLANIKAAAQVQVAQIASGVDDGSQLKAQQERDAGYQPIIEMIGAMHAAMTAPKEVMRDASGRVIGVQTKQPTVQ